MKLTFRGRGKCAVKRIPAQQVAKEMRMQEKPQGAGAFAPGHAETSGF